MNAMYFRKGDSVIIRLPRNGTRFVWAEEYVIVSVLPAVSATILGTYEARAIGSDVLEYFTVWSGSAMGAPSNVVKTDLGTEVIIQDIDDYNFDNSSCNK